MIKIDDITVVIVTFKSGKVISKCLSNLSQFKKILILDNSNDEKLKRKLEKKKNIFFYISKKNLGYAAGNNFLLKKVKTKYALIINPDTILEKKNIQKLIFQINILRGKFGIIGCNNSAKIISEEKIQDNIFYNCEFVKGYFMLTNMKAIKKVKYFDDSFFMYLEEIDLCKRIREDNFKVYVLQNFKIKHIGASSSSIGEEFDKNRNWHWLWSQYYFDKKHKGYFFCFFKYTFIFAKILLNLLIIPLRKKNKFYFYRFWGLVSSILEKKSFYRPHLF